jgi:hypothetical protein
VNESSKFNRNERSIMSSTVTLSPDNLPLIIYSEKDQVVNELKGYKMRNIWQKTPHVPPILNREAKK